MTSFLLLFFHNSIYQIYIFNCRIVTIFLCESFDLYLWKICFYDKWEFPSIRSLQRKLFTCMKNKPKVFQLHIRIAIFIHAKLLFVHLIKSQAECKKSQSAMKTRAILHL